MLFLESVRTGVEGASPAEGVRLPLSREGRTWIQFERDLDASAAPRLLEPLASGAVQPFDTSLAAEDLSA